MRAVRVLAGFLVILAAILVAPAAQANGQFCHTESTVKVSGLINVADVVICSSHQDEYGEVGDVIGLNLRVSLPNAAFTPTITVTPSTPVGCTAGTAVTRNISGTTGAAASYFNTFTTTDTTCGVALRIVIQASTTVVFDSDESFGAFCQCDEDVATDLVDDTTDDGALTTREDCALPQQSVGQHSSWFNYGCIGVLLTVAQPVQVADDASTRTAKWTADVICDAKHTTACGGNNVIPSNIVVPFEASGTCSASFDASDAAGVGNVFRHRQLRGTVTFTGTGCSAFVHFTLSSVDGNTREVHLPIIVRADSNNVHQDEACGATIPCLSNVNSTTIVNIGNASTNTSVQQELIIRSSTAERFVPMLLMLAAFVIAWWRTQTIHPKWLIGTVLFAIGAILTAAVSPSWGLVTSVAGIVCVLLIILVTNGFGFLNRNKGDL